MAISVIKQPELLSFSKNPIAFGMRDNGIIATSTSNFSTTFYLQGPTCQSSSFNGSIPPGDTITINWQGRSVTLVASATPSLNGFQFPSGDGSLSHAQSMVNYFKANKILAVDFEFSAFESQGDVIFWIGALRRWSADNPTTLSTQTNCIESPEYAVLESYQPNYKFWWTLFKDSKETIQRFEDFNLQNECLVNFQEVIDAELDFDRPSGKENNAYKCTKSFGKFFIAYAEFYGEPPTLKPIAWTNDFYVYKGGLPRTQWPNNFYFSDYLASSKRFLTWNALEKKIRANQPDYLGFIIQSATVTSVKMRINIHYTDGSATSVLGDYLEVNRYDKIILPVGYSQLDIGSQQPSKTVRYYNIYLIDQAGQIISETRKFSLDYSIKPYLNIFLYHTSIGVYESFFTSGKVEKEVSFTLASADVSIPFSFAATDPEEVEFGAEIVEQFEVNSGFVFSIEEIEKFKDFFSSEDKMIYDQKRKMLLPIKIITKSVKLWKDGNELFSLKFDYVYRFKEQVFGDLSLNFNPNEGNIGTIIIDDL